MSQYQIGATQTRENAVVVNKVLRNTYLLLGLTLAFSAVTAGFAMATNAAPMNIWMLLIGFYGLLFLTHKLANSAWGLLSVFALTGFMGYTLGPILGFYLAASNGSQLVMTALGGTAFIFFGLSAYALVSRKDFAFLNGFMFAGFLVIVAMFVANLFLQIPALQLAMSGANIFLSLLHLLTAFGGDE